MVEMELLGVKLELPSNTPVVMLREVEGRHRVLPIFIGLPEANAIAFALDGVVPPRPLTHDLLCNVIEELGNRLEKVVVNDLVEGTFFAELHLEGSAGSLQISARPSDAVALAVRVGAPVFAEEAVLDEAATEAPEATDEEAEPPEEVVEQFKEFIDKVNPEDFAS